MAVGVTNKHKKKFLTRYKISVYWGVRIKNVTLFECRGFRFAMRDGTYDETVISEIILKDVYSGLNLTHNDVVLDIGANIGIFTVLASKVGCWVVGYEPDYENFLMAEYNLRLNSPLMDGSLGTTLHNKAISDTAKSTTLYRDTVNKGRHTLIPVKERDETPVICTNILDVLGEAPYTKIKMDCEGSEYKIIMKIKDWGLVETIIFEWHRNLLSDEKFNEVWNKLENDGFRITGDKKSESFEQIILGERI